MSALAMDNTTSHSPSFELPKVPVPHGEFIAHLKTQLKTPIADVVAPYNSFEKKLREGYAQYPQSQAVQDPYVNAIPLFQGQEDNIRIRARALDDEVETQKYVMPLKSEDRKSDGALAIVGSLPGFKKNFNLFSESSLVDLDWNNVVAAGSSVVTALLPVPTKYNTSKKALREYYHQKLAPSSDIDLFIWGLDESAAIAKIKSIESSIRNAILEEVTTVRTKSAITIVSRYPTRHVQIVLRLYKSISEIITGFDVDSSCFAYDGNQVYGNPRGIGAFMTQVNTVDLSRRSPSYENRLGKYARRGFEVYCSELDRSKIDPTIFERSFARTVGLARLLVLERLPKPGDREEYLTQRREERGRPALDRYSQKGSSAKGNIKDQDPEDVAEWVYDDAISNYHSFTVPYGPKYHAKRIEKLLYTRDLLLNAEWNANKDRKVTLHRHPCFIGDAESIMKDCCGSCPQPKTAEEHETAAVENKIYVSGDVEFMKDDPGRQMIGSFNPLTSENWTEMGYVGNTTELCQKICDGELEYVKEWCRAPSSSLDRRDHTGRTPLHLATQSSTPEIVRCLVDHGARIVARLVDGTTALHIAAARGNAAMVEVLLEKSEANEEDAANKESEKQAALVRKRRAEDKPLQADSGENQSKDGHPNAKDTNSLTDKDEDFDSVSDYESTTMTDRSFVKVKGQTVPNDEPLPEDEAETEPDIYDVNVIAWDNPLSPLHIAILGGHIEVINCLIGKFGADALLPVKILNSYNHNPSHAIMTLVLSARLPQPQDHEMCKKFLSFGASTAQGDMKKISALHYLIAMQKSSLIEACFEMDEPAATSALNHIVVRGDWRPDVDTPLITSISTGDNALVCKLLDFGALPTIDFDKVALSNSFDLTGHRHDKKQVEDMSHKLRQNVNQPILLAVERDLPQVVHRMIDLGVDVNTLSSSAYKAISNYESSKSQHHGHTGESLLDLVDSKIRDLIRAKQVKLRLNNPIKLNNDQDYLDGLTPGTYEYWQIEKKLEMAKNIVHEWNAKKVEKVKSHNDDQGLKEKRKVLDHLIEEFNVLRERLLKAGAMTFTQIYPHLAPPAKQQSTPQKKESEFLTLTVDFKMAGLDETLRKGYLELYQASWEGNIDRIKDLTLAAWGLNKSKPPLGVAIQDEEGFSPFAIALYRGNLDAAKVILEIAIAQFKPKGEDKLRRRYILAESESDDDVEEDKNNLAIACELIDDRFTIDNIAAASESVGSKVSASAMLLWNASVWMCYDELESKATNLLGYSPSKIDSRVHSSVSSMGEFFEIAKWRHGKSNSLFRYAIAKKDPKLIHFLFDCHKKASKADKATEVELLSRFKTEDFSFALQKGNTEILTSMIRLEGAELPLGALIKKSGVEEIEKPKYYQGLSIGGQKMKKWAQKHADRNAHGFSTAEKVSPLLNSAYLGSLHSTEWFLGDTPSRLYREFGSNNNSHPLVKTLANASGGFSQAVEAWLYQRKNLTLHAAVLSNAPSDDCVKLIQYLISALPQSLETKSILGHTPLALAFHRGRIDVAKTLIEAGADQSTRDYMGRNILHLAIRDIRNSCRVDIKTIRSLLDLIDKRVLGSLFLERCQQGPGGLTPLARWFWQNTAALRYNIYDTKRSLEALQTILEFSNGEELTMMDGSGQFPLHQVIKNQYDGLAKPLIKKNPALLWKENAMGQTPFELAESMYHQRCVKKNPDIQPRRELAQNRDSQSFIPTQSQEAVSDAAEMQMQQEISANKDLDPKCDTAIKQWRMCKAMAAKYPGKRILIPVHEAREVAKRLADSNRERKVSDGDEDKYEYDPDDEDDDDDEKDRHSQKDEVSGWLGI